MGEGSITPWHVLFRAGTNPPATPQLGLTQMENPVPKTTWHLLSFPSISLSFLPPVLTALPPTYSLIYSFSEGVGRSSSSQNFTPWSQTCECKLLTSAKEPLQR